MRKSSGLPVRKAIDAPTTWPEARARHICHLALLRPTRLAVRTKMDEYSHLFDENMEDAILPHLLASHNKKT